MFLGFSDVYSFLGFVTSLLYNLTPIAFMFQLKHGVLKHERISIIAFISIYCNCFVYFLLSAFHTKPNQKIEPIDFCNLVGAYLGLVYIIFYTYHVYFKTGNKKKGIIIIVVIVFCSGLFALVAWITTDDNLENKWVKGFSYAAIVANVLQNLPLGFDIIYLIRNKISEKFTLFGAVFGLLNTTVWFLWAMYSCFLNEENDKEENKGKKPYHTFVANIICILMHFVQFFLFFKFRKSESSSQEEYLETPIIDGDKSESTSLNKNVNNNIVNNSESNKESEFDEFM